MIPIKINGKEYSFPTSINDLTIGQFYKLRDSQNIIEEICAITGMAKTEVANFKNLSDLDSARKLIKVLAESIQKGFTSKKVPVSVSIGGKEIRVPKELKLEPIGAFISVYNLITEEGVKNEERGAEVDFTGIIPKVIAHYFYVKVTGRLYSDEEAESDEFMELINGIKFVDAIPIANFFFRKYPNLD